MVNHWGSDIYFINQALGTCWENIGPWSGNYHTTLPNTYHELSSAYAQKDKTFKLYFYCLKSNCQVFLKDLRHCILSQVQNYLHNNKPKKNKDGLINMEKINTDYKR